eukprot:m.33890 g.33890  ORF g.33890 m.33890 type:complete len:121 (+) comp31924_c0_seq7:539-901(+)
MDEKYLMESQFSLDSLAIDDERQGEQPEQPSASEQRSELTSTGSVTTSESRSHLDSEDSQLMDSLLNGLIFKEKLFGFMYGEFCLSIKQTFQHGRSGLYRSLCRTRNGRFMFRRRRFLFL